jgi:magnesium-transporting ATPase (P-type)
MGLITLILMIGLLIVAAIALGIAAGYVASAATRVTKVSKWRKDSDLKEAHTLLSWGAVSGWVGLAIIVTLIVLYMIFGLETAQFTGGLVSKALLFLTIVILLITGSLAAAGASYIARSPNSAPAKSNGAYGHAIIAAVSALIAGVLVGSLFLYLMFHKPKSKEEKEHEAKSKEIKELKDSLVKEKEAEIEERTLKAEHSSKSLK